MEWDSKNYVVKGWIFLPFYAFPYFRCSNSRVSESAYCLFLSEFLDQINHSDEDVIWTQRIITAVLLLLQVSFSNDFLQFRSMHLSLVILHFLLFFSLWYILLCLIGSEIEYECMRDIQFYIGELRISELILMKWVIWSCNKFAIAWLKGEFWKAWLLEAIEKVGPFMMPPLYIPWTCGWEILTLLSAAEWNITIRVYFPFLRVGCLPVAMLINLCFPW